METKDEIVIQSASEGSGNIERLLDRPVSFHFMAKGDYDNRRNRSEADYIAALVQGMLSREDRPTIGIVAFSEAQQTEIENAISRLAETNKAFADRLETEIEREIDGQLCGLLIKDLENIQGDEADVVTSAEVFATGVRPAAEIADEFWSNQSERWRRERSTSLSLAPSIIWRWLARFGIQTSRTITTMVQIALRVTFNTLRHAPPAMLPHLIAFCVVWRFGRIWNLGKNMIVVQSCGKLRVH